MSCSNPNTAYIDVMENVFGGVRISTEKEPRSRGAEPEWRPRPWLTAVSMLDMNVKLASEDNDPER